MRSHLVFVLQNCLSSSFKRKNVWLMTSLEKGCLAEVGGWRGGPPSPKPTQQIEFLLCNSNDVDTWEKTMFAHVMNVCFVKMCNLKKGIALLIFHNHQSEEVRSESSIYQRLWLSIYVWKEKFATEIVSLSFCNVSSKTWYAFRNVSEKHTDNYLKFGQNYTVRFKLSWEKSKNYSSYHAG